MKNSGATYSGVLILIIVILIGFGAMAPEIIKNKIELIDLSQKLELAQRVIDGLKQEITKLNAEIERLSGELKAAESARDAAAVDAAAKAEEIKSLRTKIYGLDTQITNKQMEITRLTEVLKTAEAASDAVAADAAVTEEEKKVLQAAVSSLNVQIREKMVEIKNLTGAQDAADLAMAKMIAMQQSPICKLIAPIQPEAGGEIPLSVAGELVLAASTCQNLTKEIFPIGLLTWIALSMAVTTLKYFQKKDHPAPAPLRLSRIVQSIKREVVEIKVPRERIAEICAVLRKS